MKKKKHSSSLSILNEREKFIIFIIQESRMQIIWVIPYLNYFKYEKLNITRNWINDIYLMTIIK